MRQLKTPVLQYHRCAVLECRPLHHGGIDPIDTASRRSQQGAAGAGQHGSPTQVRRITFLRRLMPGLEHQGFPFAR
jgi:hypothetical protein